MSIDNLPIPGAQVTARKQGENLILAVQTQTDGRYRILGATEGVYLLIVAGPAHQQEIRRNIVVGSPDATVKMDIRIPLTQTERISLSSEETPPPFAYLPDLSAFRRRLTLEPHADSEVLREFSPHLNTFGGEFGALLKNDSVLQPQRKLSQWRSSISDAFQSGALNARSFFTVGPRPEQANNQYSVSAGGPLAAEKFTVFARFERTWGSSEVNANVLVPRSAEHSPLSTDPENRKVIAALLQSYGAGLPNLPPSAYTSPQHRNANASQDVDSKEGLFRLDFSLSESHSAAMRYFISDYAETPFQLVLGQNPLVNTRRTGFDASLASKFTTSLISRIGLKFDRSAVNLLPTQEFLKLFSSAGINAPVPFVDFQADSLQDIGPGHQYPRRQIANRFQASSDIASRAGLHNLKFGWATTRVQVNDLQSDHSRGTLVFAADFGRSETENFLLGQPSLWIASSGNLYRGFRNWEHVLYAGDQISLSRALTLNLGLRYELESVPNEVNHLTRQAYSADVTNAAPSFGFAWNPSGGGTIFRGGYGMSYGTIFPATSQFSRFQPPEVCVKEIYAPDMKSILNPTAASAIAPARCAVRRLSPDLVTPYSHQYSFTLDQDLPGTFSLRLAYVGSRSVHLFSQGIRNRARPVPGFPLATATINERRPDARTTSVAEIESNGRAYYDSARVSLEKKLSRGLIFRAAYKWSKNIDIGSDFASSASGLESPSALGAASSENLPRTEDLKSWSLLDAPHNLIFSYTYSLPPLGPLGWPALLLRGWEVSGTAVYQSGLPFSILSGDAPGIGNVDGVFSDRPNLLQPTLLGRSVDHPDAAPSLLPRAAFNTLLPPSGRGNIGYNVFRKDGVSNWNLALGKILRFRGARDITVMFRAAFRNLLNHPQFARPGDNLMSPSFSLITDTAQPGRTVDISVRAEF
ncbi:MAG: hypothetical protein A3F68_08095 [Acidobacteria bacterium RIFCSPLOWO2_12_FULL_54_10]|nr:MAG: hypothetical protein A3F68_08095 [Acidobacteria bacterium RIFCSPLOWO2_12_FULL_54_10]